MKVRGLATKLRVGLVIIVVVEIPEDGNWCRNS
jgi:hypothetical protein